MSNNSTRQPLFNRAQALQAATQRTFIDFLMVEMELGWTFLSWALCYQDQRRKDRYVGCVAKCAQAADTVRRFIATVEDVTIRMEIANRLAELDRAISFHELFQQSDRVRTVGLAGVDFGSLSASRL